MVSDGRIDGQFKIDRGQGLSQAIRDELGLTPTDCDKLGSVWTKIFEQVDEQQKKNIDEGKSKIYSGGNDLSGSSSSNYVVQVDQVVTFSREIWDSIVKLVNDKLGKNIESVEQQEKYESTTQKQSANTQSQNVDNDAAAKDLEAIKTKVLSTTASNNEAAQKDAEKIVKELKSELKSKWVNISNAKSSLSKINSENVAYVVQAYPEIATDIDEVFRMGAGFDKDEVYQYVLKPLLQKCESFKPPISYKLGNKSINSENASELSLDAMKDLITKASKKVLERIEADLAEGNTNSAKAQEEFDKANQLLANVANMNPKPKVNDLGNGKYSVVLESGESICVTFDKNGELTVIGVSTDPTKCEAGDYCEVTYKPNSANCRLNHTQKDYADVQAKHNWENLKTVVMKIFGRVKK